MVTIPLPGQGHLNQFLHLSRIISSHKIHVHFVSTPTHIRQAKLRAHHGWHANSYFHFHDLTVPSFETPPPDPTAHVQHLLPLFTSLPRLWDPLCAFLHDLAKTSKRVVVIIDYFMIWLIRDLPSVPKTESYCFHSISSFSMYYANCVITEKPVLINGEPAKDLPPHDSVFPEHLWGYLKVFGKTIQCNQGNLYNSCRAIEGQFLDLLAEEKLTNTDKHWAIGPFNPVSLPDERKTFNKHLEWLDKQSPNSVIFISFGSTCSLLDEQVNEIALGLERSGQNFMWVLRDADTADIFVGESKRYQLPEGFEQRVEGRGIVIRDWAPQLEILGHPSTGGFMSHCGWNSSVESISMGVPIAAWPMHSEQALNAILIVQLLKMGLMVKKGGVGHEIVRSATIEEAVKTLMASPAGNDMRQRAKELSTAVKQSVKEDGATTAEISSFIAHITR